MTLEQIRTILADLEDVTPDPYTRVSPNDTFRVACTYADDPAYMKVVVKYGLQLLFFMWHRGWCEIDYDAEMGQITPEQMMDSPWYLTGMGANILQSFIQRYERRQ